MTRLAFLAHRYLGIGLGLIVLIWCLSGVVMMYVQYPALTPEDEVRTLDALDLSNCCVVPIAAGAGGAPSRVRIEMLDGRPVLRIWRGVERELWDLTTGEHRAPFDEEGAQAVAQTFAKHAGVADFAPVGLIERDQWTVYGAYNPYRPLYKFEGSDPDATHWYVSSQTGEVVQATSGSVRFWNWLGAVPHWLYPTLLRQHTQLWSQVVIWLTIAGTFLTLLGLYIGLRQYKSRRSGRYSPYRGAALWHHYAGLIFGLFTLVWLVSGFFSMNPWGLLEGRSFAVDSARLHGGELSVEDAFSNSLAHLARGPLPDGTVRLEAHKIDGTQFLVAWDRAGARHRIDGGFVTGAIEDTRVFAKLAGALRPGVEVIEADWLRTGDAYYYDHHDTVRFPVYRIVYGDGERFYLDALTGALVFAVDADRRLYRWLHYGLHRGDFVFMRGRPLWDFIMIVLLGGVTIGVATGVWMGWRRLSRRRGRYLPPFGANERGSADFSDASGPIAEG